MSIAARLRHRWYLVLLAALIAVGVAATTQVTIGHGGLKRKRSVYHVGAGQILVDTDPSTLTNVHAAAGGLSSKAQLIAQYATGPAVVGAIAKLAGVKPSQLKVQAESGQANKAGGTDAKKSLVGSGPESVVLKAAHGQLITISAQTSSKQTAKALVNATITGLTRAIVRLQNAQSFNHVTTSKTSTTSTTSTTTSTAAKAGKTGKAGKAGKAGQAAKAKAVARNAAKAKKAALLAKQRAAQKAIHISASKIVLRRFGAVTAAKVLVSPSKSKAIEYFIGVFLVLLVLILVIDNLLQGSRRGSPVAAVDTSPDA